MLSTPARCWLCHLPLQIAHHGLCTLCLHQLPLLPALCPCCGLPATAAQRCGRCLKNPPPWHRLTCVSDYTPPLSDWVQQLKFSGAIALRVMLARLLLLKLLTTRRNEPATAFDLVLSVPLHHQRAWQRGFNQSALLAQPLARWLRCEYREGVSRIRRGGTQHQLNARARRHNLRSAFRLEMPVQDRHILLIDDVVTTGSTVAEISRLLQAEGAASIHIGCLCRTL